MDRQACPEPVEGLTTNGLRRLCKHPLRNAFSLRLCALRVLCGEPNHTRNASGVGLPVNTMKVHDRCMTRINVDIDDQACAEVMRRYRLATKREAINLALRMLAAETASVDEARSLRGIGWEGDLDAMRSNRA